VIVGYRYLPTFLKAFDCSELDQNVVMMAPESHGDEHHSVLVTGSGPVVQIRSQPHPIT
jgi:hypothetical protein